MKTFWLLFFFILCSTDDVVYGSDGKAIQINMPGDPHEGHKHASGEDCDLSGTPSTQAIELASQVTHLVQDKELSYEFCEAIASCDKKVFATGYFPSPEEMCLSAREKLKYARHRLKTKKIGTCGMTPEELTAVFYYMQEGYTCINPHLWKVQDAEPKAALLAERANSGLQKFPRYQGIVVRGANLPDQIKAQHTLGATVTYEAFTSTSTNREVAEDFSGNSMFVIYSDSGRPVMNLGGESEVLFPSGIRFRIIDINQRTKKDDSENKITASYYVMREVSGKENPQQRSAADKRVLDLIAANKSKKMQIDIEDSDQWSCSANEAIKIPEHVKQEKPPSTRYFGN